MFTKANPMFRSYPSITPTLLLGVQLGVTLFFFALPAQVFGYTAARWTGETLNGQFCRGKAQGFGPFNYLARSQNSTELAMVEDHHFTRQVESLVQGQSGSIINDLDYTLVAWPNHHRALSSVIQYAILKKEPPLHSPPECYLQRAINFIPTDVTPRLLYAIYLHKLGYKEKALQQYKEVEEISPKNPELHYNMGLLLISMKNYEEANIHAQKAYQAGYPLPGLKNQLTKLGYWRDQ
ncbi:MAG: tetratricopeptide repeat protein [Methylococcales bacterium]